MLGWMVVVFRKAKEPHKPATTKCPHASRLAIWQTGLGGIDWLDQMKNNSLAHFLAYNGGYPFEYTAQAKHLLPIITHDNGPPHANPVWRMSLEDLEAGATPSVIGRTVIDSAEAGRCHPEEWLVVEAWDLS